MCRPAGRATMSQTTFDDDELFGEAADEVRDDVEAALEAARAELPDPDDVWETDADNVLGVLNGLRSAMDPGDAEEHLRDAKKWYTMGERADAFDDADDLAADIETVEAVVADMAEAREGVSDLAGTVPELRSTLADAADESDESDDADAADESDESDDADADAADADDGEEAAADGGVASEASDTSSDQGSDGGEEQATLDAEDD